MFVWTLVVSAFCRLLSAIPSDHTTASIMETATRRPPSSVEEILLTLWDRHFESGTLDRNLVSHFLKVVKAGYRKTCPKAPQNLQKSSSGGSWQYLGRVLASELRLGRVLGASWRVLDASWGQLESSWRVLEASWKCFGSLRDVPGIVLEGFGDVFARFFGDFLQSQAKIKN